MLRSFRVANHKSIRTQQELALMPAYDPPRPVVPVAAVYGANATGKSNLLDGLWFMQAAVRASFGRWEAGSGVPRIPFRLDPAMFAEPSTFVVDLALPDGQYVYGFNVDDSEVVDEWLYAYRETNRKTVIFERTGLDLTLGDSLRERTSRTKLLTGAMRDNSLLLSVATQVGEQPEFAPVYRWFGKSLLIRTPRIRRHEPLVHRVPRAMELHAGYLDLVRVADLDITDIRVEERDVPSTEVDHVRAQQLEQEIHSLRQAIEAVDEDVAEQLRARVLRLDLSRRSLSVARRLRSLIFVHGEGGALMTEAEQSAGTIAYLDILSDVLEVLATGGVIVIDELGTSLHPRLLARIIELFRDEQVNPHHAQLVFATHDATLLGTSFGEEILRRDEIWFTEKRQGATTLYPLTDFHPRKEENRERRYLGGSYGGVPAVFSDTLVEQLLASRPEPSDAAS
jgi:hypothetical protein